MKRFSRSLAGLLAVVLFASTGLLSVAAYTTVDPWIATDFVTSLANSGGIGPYGIAFDGANASYILDRIDGHIYKYNAQGGKIHGGTPATADLVSPVAFGGDPVDIIIDAGGHLYLSEYAADQIIEVDRATLTQTRVVTSGGPNPLSLALDPKSDTLYFSTFCAAPGIMKIDHPASATPAVSTYADLSTQQFGYAGYCGGSYYVDGISIGPDGTIYTNNGDIIAPGGTRVAHGLFGPPADGIAVAADGSFILINQNDGVIRQAFVDNPVHPSGFTTPYSAFPAIFSGGSRGDFAAGGPDGCFYATQTDSVVRLANKDGSCTPPLFSRNGPGRTGQPQQTDTTPPVIAGTAKTQGGVYTPGMWTNQPVTVTWTCTDEQGGSGSDATKTTLQPTTVVNASVAQVASTGDCYDKAGNKASPGTFGPINIDPIPPTITGAGTLPGGAAYTPGTWTNQQVSVGFTCTDNTGGSGVKTNAVSTPVSVTTEGQQTVSSSGDCVDQAGNKAQPASLAVWYDKTPPAITGPANNGLYPVGQVPCIAANDALSGLAGPATVTLDGAAATPDAKGCLTNVPVGQHTVAVTATDKAGNTATSTAKFIVFANAASGQFVLGDKTVAAATPSTTVTFWGAQWAKQNSLSGGAGPDAFKGYDNSAPSLACGATWTTDPGNSSDPPATIPGYMAVIVSSHVDKNGSNISGDIKQIVIVKTDAGYAGNPGHAGTGTIVGTYCG